MQQHLLKTLRCESPSSPGTPGSPARLVEGLGFSLRKKKSGYLVIQDMLAESPAKRCGQIKIGDLLLCVNRVNVVGQTVEQANTIIRQTQTKIVDLSLMRNQRRIEVSVERGIIPWANSPRNASSPSSPLLIVDHHPSFPAASAKAESSQPVGVSHRYWEELISVVIRKMTFENLDEGLRQLDSIVRVLEGVEPLAEHDGERDEKLFAEAVDCRSDLISVISIIRRLFLLRGSNPDPTSPTSDERVAEQTQAVLFIFGDLLTSIGTKVPNETTGENGPMFFRAFVDMLGALLSFILDLKSVKLPHALVLMMQELLQAETEISKMANLNWSGVASVFRDARARLDAKLAASERTSSESRSSRTSRHSSGVTLGPDEENAKVVATFIMDGWVPKRDDEGKRQMVIKGFEVLKPISRGAFGSVYLVRDTSKQRLAAMKVLPKSDLILKNQVHQVLLEKQAMIATEGCPFVPTLYCSFQSRENLYLVMEFLPGGDLFSLLSALGGLDEDLVRFYAAELVLALRDIHRRGIVHRDVKPDNTLLAADGHIRLTDFGLAKTQYTTPKASPSAPAATPGPPHALFLPTALKRRSSDPNLSETRYDSDPEKNDEIRPRCQSDEVKNFRRDSANRAVGTPHYMPPEALDGSLYQPGLDHAQDFWALGVMIYELLSGDPPFTGETEGEVFDAILAGKFERPEEVSDDVWHVVCGLLNRDVSDRVRFADEIMSHPFFAPIDWESLLLIEPPWKPNFGADKTDLGFFSPRKLIYDEPDLSTAEYNSPTSSPRSIGAGIFGKFSFDGSLPISAKRRSRLGTPTNRSPLLGIFHENIFAAKRVSSADDPAIKLSSPSHFVEGKHDGKYDGKYVGSGPSSIPVSVETFLSPPSPKITTLGAAFASSTCESPHPSTSPVNLVPAGASPQKIKHRPTSIIL